MKRILLTIAGGVLATSLAGCGESNATTSGPPGGIPAVAPKPPEELSKKMLELTKNRGGRRSGVPASKRLPPGFRGR